MSIYRIFMKLMSRHLVSHLLAPLIIGVTFEISVAWLIAWYRGTSISFREYLISPERLVLYGGILVSYLIIAGVYVHREARPPWDNTLTAQLDRILTGATGFFATCTIPMKEWFDPYTQQYFSQIMKYQLGPGAFSQERVLIFRRRGELARAREQYLDGHYAKPLAEIHKNYGIKLGFLDRADIDEINGRIKCPKLDFALITYPDRRAVYTFDKRGSPIKLEVLTTEEQIAPYEALVAEIRKNVFEATGDLKPECRFAP